MAEFQATADDLRELIRSRQRLEARRQAPYPLGAAAVALVLIPVYAPAALVVFGVCLGWSLSTYWSLRNLAAAYQWRYAWLQEPVVVEVLEEGLRDVQRSWLLADQVVWRCCREGASRLLCS
jgi:hypothetical protein